MNFFKTIVAAGLVAASTSAFAADITGAGATFPFPIYSKWADAYKKETGNGLNYQSIGSGGGIKQIKAKTVTFGASDMPLKPEELREAGLVQFPTVTGGDVPVVNLEGVKPGELVLDGPALAAMFRAQARAVKLLEHDPTPYIHYFVAETGGLLELHELQTWRLLHAAPQPYTRERFEDTYNWTVKWNMVVPGATYENTVDNRAWE